MLEVLNLTRMQGNFLLSDITFSVGDGEYMVILGPSGAGKTTLLECIAGLRKVDSGSIIIDGRDVTKVPPEKRGVAYVFQTSALFPNMTVRENIEFGLKMRGIPREERAKKVLEVAKKLSIDHLLDRMPSTLSGGEAKRVELARALVVEPRALLLDEPLEFLDRRMRSELRKLLKEIKREWDAAFVHVTHDQAEGFFLADKLGILSNGKLIEAGSPEDIFWKPKKLFTALFVGYDNVYKGKVVESNEFSSIVDIGGVRICVAKKHEGEVYVGFRSEDVVVLKGRTLTSMRNIFEATVLDYEFEGPVVILHLDAGFPVKAAITRGSFRELEIKRGSKVIIGFKATAVRVFREV